MSDRNTTGYLMEHETEGARIQDKTDLAATSEQLKMVGLAPGMRALEVGCASGAGTLVMAELAFPSGVVGVDMSESRLEEARSLAREKGVSNADFKIGDAYALPFADESFDLVWNRFLMEYLREPMAAIREMKRVTKPGGVVVSADLDGNCLFHYPIDPELQQGLTDAMDLLSKWGFDPFVGRKLYYYYRQVGFAGIKVDLAFHHLIAGEPTESQRRNWYEKIDTVGQKLRGIYPDSSELQSLSERLKRIIDDPDTFTYSPLIIVSGKK